MDSNKLRYVHEIKFRERILLQIKLSLYKRYGESWRLIFRVDGLVVSEVKMLRSIFGPQSDKQN